MPAKKGIGKKNPSKKEETHTHSSSQPAPKNGESNNHQTANIMTFLEKKLSETLGKKSEHKKKAMIDATQKELSSMLWSKNIQTDYDQILELVKVKKTIKLGEIVKALKIPIERVEEKIKILEENNLVNVHYPPIGGAVVTFKPKKED